VLEPSGAEAAELCKSHIDLLRSLAYDSELFNRCAEVIVRIITAGDVEQRKDATRTFASLFHLCLSGTHATVEQRLEVIEALLRSPDAKRRALGGEALRASLEALQFLGMPSFDFGARPRDYGYWPRTNEDVRHWFRTVLRSVTILACAGGSSAREVRAALAEQFNGLWLRAGIPDELGAACRSVGENRFWPEGWLAVRQTMDLLGKGTDREHLSKLIEIEKSLRPRDLPQRVRSVVFSTRALGISVDDFEDDSSEDIQTRMERSDMLARDLGRAAAADHAALDELIPEAVAGDGRLWQLGRGLCEGTEDTDAMWALSQASIRCC
jgi:hypothetical protein